MKKDPLVLVSHPGRQHSHQAALALEQAGMLAAYWAGVPAVAAQAERLPAFLRRRFARYAPLPLDPRRVSWFPLTPGQRSAFHRSFLITWCFSVPAPVRSVARVRRVKR